jgi:RecA/RadA recombinase
LLKITDGLEMPVPDVIATPSLKWNQLLGGGLWTDRMHTFWGNPGGGKTTMSLKILAEAQKKGYKPVMVDTEGTMPVSHMIRCGLDVGKDQFIYLKGYNELEAIQKEILPLMRNGNKYTFLFDSINGIVRSDFFDKDEKHGGMALFARSQNELALKLNGHLTTDHMVIFVAQQTVDLGNMASPTVGKYGNAIDHYSTNIIKIYGSWAKGEMEKNEDGSISDRTVMWNFTKSKQAAITGAGGTYSFNIATAEIDNDAELIDIAGQYDIIDTSKKGWLGYKGQSYRKADLVNVISDPDERQVILDTIESLNG